MAAQLQHIGHRSGRTYFTSVAAHVGDDGVLIPLTFGNRSDWVRNVVAAGQCVVRFNGTAYQAVQPQFLDAADARPVVRATFNPIERMGFRFLGIRQFMRLRVAN